MEIPVRPDRLLPSVTRVRPALGAAHEKSPGRLATTGGHALGIEATASPVPAGPPVQPHRNVSGALLPYCYQPPPGRISDFP